MQLPLLAWVGLQPYVARHNAAQPLPNKIDAANTHGAKWGSYPAADPESVLVLLTHKIMHASLVEGVSEAKALLQVPSRRPCACACMRACVRACFAEQDTATTGWLADHGPGSWQLPLS